MVIRLVCPIGHRLVAHAQLAGKTAPCPLCHQMVRLPVRHPTPSGRVKKTWFAGTKPIDAEQLAAEALFDGEDDADDGGLIPASAFEVLEDLPDEQPTAGTGSASSATVTVTAPKQASPNPPGMPVRTDPTPAPNSVTGGSTTAGPVTAGSSRLPSLDELFPVQRETHSTAHPVAPVSAEAAAAQWLGTPAAHPPGSPVRAAPAPAPAVVPASPSAAGPSSSILPALSGPPQMSAPPAYPAPPPFTPPPPPAPFVPPAGGAGPRHSGLALGAPLPTVGAPASGVALSPPPAAPFGSSPAVGSPPAYGSPPAFGSPPTFGPAMVSGAAVDGMMPPPIPAESDLPAVPLFQVPTRSAEVLIHEIALGRLRMVYLLAAVLCAVILGSSLPGWSYFNLLTAPGWARAVLILAGVQLVYVIWMVSLPDWSTVWMGMLLFAISAAIYAMAWMIAAFTAPGQPMLLGLHTLETGQVTSWCALMVLLLATMSLICGKLSATWRKEFELARQGKHPGLRQS